MALISKSKFLSGLQCSKLIWVHYNHKSRIPPTDPATQAIYDQGHVVGELAKKLYPDGIEIGEGLVREFGKIFGRSREGLTTRRPLFEPAFAHENGYARADILDPVGADEWDIVEVKSSTEVKGIHVDDLAFQRYVFEGAGVRIRNCYLLHINNQYVRQGDIDPHALFTKEDVTALVADRLPQIEAELQQMTKLIGAIDEPVVRIGVHCDDPYTCPLHDHCWANVPEHSVLTLYNIRKTKAFDLFDSGITEIGSIPSTHKLTTNQRIQRDAVVSNSERIDVYQITKFLRTLVYPLYYLDFETFSTAIPLFDGTKPYQQIPFQFSLHIQASPDSELVPHMFLSRGIEDPRPVFMQRLQELLGSFGSIVVYNQSFEKRILRECTEAMPKFEKWWREIETRIVDLLVPFRSMDYYHPAQHGSASIKAVLPVLTDLRYDGEIADGATASSEYMRVTFGEVDNEERLRVRRALEQYCGLDTLAMVKLVERLTELVE